MRDIGDLWCVADKSNGTSIRDQGAHAEHATPRPALPRSGWTSAPSRLNPSQDASLAVYVNYCAPGPQECLALWTVEEGERSCSLSSLEAHHQTCKERDEGMQEMNPRDKCPTQTGHA